MASLEGFSLVLKKDGDIVNTSDKKGLRPLMDCLLKFMGTQETYELHDKVIGLAAARLIVHSNIINKVKTPLISKPGLRLLKGQSIETDADKEIENILNQDRTAICPMEKRALDTEDNAVFFDDLKKIFQPV